MSKGVIWIPFYVGDYLADTMHLTTLGHGAYLLLLMHYWRSGPIPDDDLVLAGITRLGDKEWRRLAPAIRPFFTVEGGHLHQKRADAERDRLRDISVKRSASAVQMHAKKGGKTDASAHAIASQNGHDLDANAVQVHHHSTAHKGAKPLTSFLESARARNLPARGSSVADPLATGMGDLVVDADGHPTVNGGWQVDVVFNACCREARIDQEPSLAAWQPVIGWLREGYESPEILWLIRKVAARPDYRPPRSLAYFSRAIRDECKPGHRPDGRNWHE